MIKLKNIIVEDTTKLPKNYSESHGSMPENYEKITESKGFYICAGQGDWENGFSFIAIYSKYNDIDMSGDIRFWFTVKYLKSNESSETKKEVQKEVCDEGHKLVNKISKLLKSLAKNKNKVYVSDLVEYCIKVIKNDEISPYVNKWGIDVLSWTPYNIKNIK